MILAHVVDVPHRDDVLQAEELTRPGIISVSTMPKPEKIAPATKYGGKIVVCQPGSCDTAKSNETTECTESTSGVARAASSR